jgi:hypothetical protein
LAEYDVVPPALAARRLGAVARTEPGRRCGSPTRQQAGGQGHRGRAGGGRVAAREGAPVELDLIEGVPNAEARLRYAAADVVSRPAARRLVRMFAIESMALAKPVVVHLDEAGRRRDRGGVRARAAARARGRVEPRGRARRLVEVRPELPELGRRSREYVERVHAHTAVAHRVLEIYERVMPISS